MDTMQLLTKHAIQGFENSGNDRESVKIRKFPLVIGEETLDQTIKNNPQSIPANTMQLTTKHVIHGFENSGKDTESIKIRKTVDVFHSVVKETMI